jgi:hypothetical protein
MGSPRRRHRQLFVRQVFAQLFANRFGGTLDAARVYIPEEQPRQARVRRIVLLAPEGQLFRGERDIIVTRRSLDGIVIGRVSLDDDTPAQQTASCAAGHLRQELKRSLCGTDIRQVQ